jgi:NodT family efflux transporter outer membrane factor (OMF) lipoprotein
MRSSRAGPGFARWRSGVSQRIPGAAAQGWRVLIPGGRRLARSLAVLGLVASSAGCILTKDLPDPALDVPAGYKAARLTTATDAPPTLDWWRGFRSRELTGLMEEAQTVNLDIAAATARFRQADAQARIVGAALLPSLSGTGQEAYSRTSGSSSSGLTNGGREVVNYSASLSASYELDFWGKNRDAAQAAEEIAVANRFDRDVVALTTLTTVANAYFQVLAAQDRIRTAQRNIASAERILNAIKERLRAGTGNDLDVAQQESVLANQRALVPPLRQTLDQNINALATLVSRPPEALRVTGGSLNKIAVPRVTPGLPSELLTQRPDIRRQESQLASATANVGSARAQFFPSIQLTGQGGYQSSALSSLFQPHAAFFSMVGSLTQPIFDGGRILGNFEFTKARQDELLQTYRKTVVQAFADVDNALMSIRQTTERLRLQREVVAASRRAFQLSEQQLGAGTADIVTVLNTQLTLFQAEDSLSQAQLARLLAIVSLYQALGGGWEPRMERPVDAL